MSVESYKHKFAKSTLLGWLREAAADQGTPHLGIWEEYPFAIDDKNEVWGQGPVWDELDWFGLLNEHGDKFKNRTPTYDELIGLKLLPVCIFDIAIQHKGTIVYGIEVVHKNPVSPTKAAYFNRLGIISVYEIEADWILSQVKRPDRLSLRKIW